MRPYLIILYLFLLTIVGASADGLNNSGVQTWGHLLEVIEVLGLFMVLIVFKLFTWRQVLLALGSYICLRVFAFDYMYNIAAGNEVYYIGGSNWWDLVLSRQYPTGLLFGRVIFLITGVAIPIKHL
ncbi:hypothetical protein LCGC14_2773070, partial [marine sediment metagenome]